VGLQGSDDAGHHPASNTSVTTVTQPPDTSRNLRKYTGFLLK
jgi:hypothetical protein